MLNGTMTVKESQTLEDAVHQAAQLSASGTTVLFSPACASFDMFRDFEDRGRIFKSIVRTFADRVEEESGRPHGP
jgi:UDP-N-acetylmuramoylalanine--D-glutamate ligase